MMHLRTDIGQLQRLHDAIAITMDAIRRIAVASADPNQRTAPVGTWVPAPPLDNGMHRARLEHSAWQPSWPAPFPPPAPHAARWLDWQQATASPAWSSEPGWTVHPWWGPFRSF